MLELEKALDRILATLPKPIAEVVPLHLAYGRILTENVPAKVDLPLFDNSAMDGYAVRASDVALATENSPARLKLTGRIAAGESFKGEVSSGTCVRIFTGSPLPEGADAVVMQEETTFDKVRPHEILFQSSAKPWENVRLKGEDVKKGQPIAEKGILLGVGQLGLMAATGIQQAVVGSRPRVAVIATGSELRELGQSLAHGQIYESNRLALSALISAAGGLPKVFDLIPDSLDGIREALLNAFSDCDVIVTSGGVSVGEMDFIKSAFEGTGGELQFWRVAIKPGRPFVFGRHREKFLFGLPGNPVSAFVTFLLLVRPALLKWQGATSLNLPSHTGVLGEPLINSGQRRHFIRVKVNSKGKVALAGVQASHMLGGLAEANGLVDLPAETTMPAGSEVEVLRWC